MTAFLKLLALLTSIATTVLVIVSGARRGLMIFWTIFGILKVAVVVIFVALLLLILYLLLTKKSAPPNHS